MIFCRSSNVPTLEEYSQYGAYLRHDFQYRCAYCLSFTDEDTGEIDHHRPMNPPEKLGKNFSHLSNVYDNLYWACGKCNRIKGNRWPTDWQYSHRRRFLDPCVEDHDDHWALEADGMLTPKTATGKYTVRNIRLNREALVRRRAEQKRLEQKATQIEVQLQQKDMADELRMIYGDYLNDIRKSLTRLP